VGGGDVPFLGNCVNKIPWEGEMRQLLFWLLMLSATLAGAAESDQAKWIPLENIQKLELISVMPEVDPSSILNPGESKPFHGHLVLGRLDVQNQSAIQEIIGALNGSLAAPISNKCIFFPRHALQVFYKDSEVDYLICYQCGDVEKFRGDHPESLSIEKSSKNVLDRYLTAAKIPLAP
jgi:hypothetical protein